MKISLRTRYFSQWNQMPTVAVFFKTETKNRQVSTVIQSAVVYFFSVDTFSKVSAAISVLWFTVTADH